MAITAVCLPAALAYMVVACTFTIFAFNVIDAGTFVYLAVPIGILIVSGGCGLVGRSLTGRLYPCIVIAGVAMLVLSLIAVGWGPLGNRCQLRDLAVNPRSSRLDRPQDGWTSA